MMTGFSLNSKTPNLVIILIKRESRSSIKRIPQPPQSLMEDMILTSTPNLISLQILSFIIKITNPKPKRKLVFLRKEEFWLQSIMEKAYLKHLVFVKGRMLLSLDVSINIHSLSEPTSLIQFQSSFSKMPQKVSIKQLSQMIAGAINARNSLKPVRR